MSFEVKEGLFYDIPSNVYHSTKDTYSSSQLKDLLEGDTEIFFDKYIAKTVARESIPAFDIGTYFHTAILEPEKVEDECIVFEGIRRGEKWEEFKKIHSNKAIVTRSEMATAEVLINAVKNSPVAVNRLKRGSPEVSGFLKIRVSGRQVYAITWKKKLGKYGWVDATVPATGTDIWMKVRADLLAETFILDLKSTTGNAKLKSLMKQKVSSLHYDLSAALYLDIFSAIKKTVMHEFVWTFASKDFGNCKSWIAENDNILIGRAKWKKAVVALAEGIESNWVIEDTMGILEPSYFEYVHLKEKAEDIL